MPATRQRIPLSSFITLGVLVYINLLNYMDRFTVSSVLTDIQRWFDIHKKKAGLLQTIFVCAYMVCAPLFGYLGDRFPRKYVMAVGITIWSCTTFAGSFMGKQQFWGFFALRGLVGIGEASYSTVAPTIIADLFVGERRTMALCVFYFAIPCGGGLGYIVGSKVAKAVGGWQWALRVTPGFGIIAAILSVILIREPKRGVIEVDPNTTVAEESIQSKHSYIEDLKQIKNVKSFIWATGGATSISFVLGGIAWWAPEFAYFAEQSRDYKESRKIDSVSYLFGIVTFVSGLIGVLVGATISRRWRKTNQKADALLCGICILLATPFLFLGLYVANKIDILLWILLCFAEILFCMFWTPNADILLYVIPPNCRSTAEAIQIVFIHLLGDAFSPFIIGAISDAYTDSHTMNGEEASLTVKHLGLLYSLYLTPFICCIGALCYFISSAYVPQDKINAEVALLEQLDIQPEASLNNIPANQDLFDGPDHIIVPDVYDVDSDNEVQSDKDTELLLPKQTSNVIV